MGLDTTHDAWHGPYSAFSRWREALAVAAGYEVVAHPVAPGLRMILVDWGHLQHRLQGDWDETPADPLLVLIAHSDCEGEIRPAQAGPLADRIEALAPLVPDEDHGSWDPGWMRERARRFVAGLRRAATAGEAVRFG